MADWADYDDRINWLTRTIGGQADKGYIHSFCEKIIPGFDETSIIPKNRLNYVSVPIKKTDRKSIKKFLRTIGITYRSYIMDIEGCEILLRKDRYLMYRIAISKDVFDYEDFHYDVDLNKLNEEYKKYASTKTA